MPDDSLIDEMRAAIRGDRERAEQRRTRELRPATAELAVSSPEVESQPEPEVARGRRSLRWFQRRQDR